MEKAREESLKSGYKKAWDFFKKPETIVGVLYTLAGVIVGAIIAKLL